MRVLWGLGGVTSLGLGTVGIFLPLLPTVPFVLLAAFCFSRSSDRLHDWLVAHPIFGPSIEDWRRNGSISKRGKYLATLSIALVFGLSVGLKLAAWLLITQALILSAVLVFIWSRPTGSTTEPGTGRPTGRESGTE